MKALFLALALSTVMSCAHAQQISPETARQASLMAVKMKALVAHGISSQAAGCLFENVKTNKKDGDECAKFLASLKGEMERRAGWSESVILAEKGGFINEIQPSVIAERLSRDQIDQIASEIFPEIRIK